VSDPDRGRCGDVLTQLLSGVQAPAVAFADQRLNELLFRLRARRDEAALSEAERARWRDWMRHKLVDGVDGALTLPRFQQAVAELDAPTEIVEALCEHAKTIELRLAEHGGANR